MRGLVCWTCVAAALATAAMAEPRLRYAWKPGDWLTFDLTIRQRTPQDGARALLERRRVNLWIFDEDDGRMVAWLDQATMQGDIAGPVEGVVIYLTEMGVEGVAPEFIGRLPEFRDALNILPTAPTSLVSRGPWTAANLFGQRFQFTPDESETATQKSVCVTFEQVGWPERKGRLWFDFSQGLFRRAQFPCADAQFVGDMRVTSRVQNDAAWRQRRAREFTRFRRAERLQQAILDESLEQGDVGALKRLADVWRETLRDIPDGDISPIRMLAEARLNTNEVVERQRTRVEYARRWSGRQARPWVLPTPDGRTATSEELRRGVTLEYFWRSDHPMSVSGLDRLRELTLAGADERINVVCVNMDVRRRLTPEYFASVGPDLTHVLGESLAETESVPEYPAYRLIDADGVIRRIGFGWRMDFASWARDRK